MANGYNVVVEVDGIPYPEDGDVGVTMFLGQGPPWPPWRRTMSLDVVVVLEDQAGVRRTVYCDRHIGREERGNRITYSVWSHRGGHVLGAAKHVLWREYTRLLMGVWRRWRARGVVHAA